MIKEIFKKSWEVTWKNKFLWLFGLLIFLFSQGGEVNLFLNNFKIIGNQLNNLLYFKNFLSNNKFSILIENLKNSFFLHPFQVFIFLFFCFIIIISIIFINLSSQGGMIYCSKKLFQNKKSDFKEGFIIGIKNFWALLEIFILNNLLILASFLIFVLPFVALFIKNSSPQWFFTALLLFLLVFLPINVFIYIITRFSYCYLIIKNNKPLNSIKNSFKLFLKNWLFILKIIFLLFFIYFISLTLITILLFLINLPIILIGMILNYIISFNLFWFIIIFDLFLIIALSLTIISILTTFKYNLLVNLFNELIVDKKVDKMGKI
ncbi:MAG: hypothetical protein Athens101410_360 [Parcubacteria group bacterium Athens1014_10]|nr:MAG: hypothetical protein Athens101410_360 [Parcubacteria group bacterium Athens1014_10]TSD05110.1 MAG: hypothetical protein Athens071412_479 [Parcubacteria group bacterium Athens0714_12]